MKILAIRGKNLASLYDGFELPLACGPIADAGVFDPRAVERLWRKCEASGGGEQFSNADNMALVGVLSTGLLHEELVRRPPSREPPGAIKTVVDRVMPRGAGPPSRPGA